MKSPTLPQLANAILGAIAIVLGILAASQVLPQTWAPYLALAISIDSALQRFLPAALGPAAAAADPQGGPPAVS